MNRRNFIARALGIAAVAPLLPAAIAKPDPLGALASFGKDIPAWQETATGISMMHSAALEAAVNKYVRPQLAQAHFMWEHFHG